MNNLLLFFPYSDSLLNCRKIIQRTFAPMMLHYLLFHFGEVKDENYKPIYRYKQDTKQKGLTNNKKG